MEDECRKAGRRPDLIQQADVNIESGKYSRRFSLWVYIRLFVFFSRVGSFPSFVCSVFLLLLLFVYCVKCPRFSVIFGSFLCIVSRSAFASLLICCFISRSLVFHLSYLTVSGLSCFLVTLSLLSCLSYLLSSSLCACDLISLILLYHFSWPAISFSWPAALSLLACHLVSLTLLSRLSKPAISHLSPCRLTPIPLRTRPFWQDGKVVLKTWSGS